MNSLSKISFDDFEEIAKEAEEEENKEKEETKNNDVGRTLTIRVDENSLIYARQKNPMAVFSEIIRKGIHKIPPHLLKEYDGKHSLEETLIKLNELTKKINTHAIGEEPYFFSNNDLSILKTIKNSKTERFIKDKNKLPYNNRSQRIKIRINKEEKEILRKLKKNNRLFFQDVANAILLDFNFDHLRNYDHQRNIDREYSIASNNLEQIKSNMDIIKNKKDDKNKILLILNEAFSILNKISEEDKWV